MYVIVIDNYDWVTYHHAGISPQPVFCVSTVDKSPNELFEELLELCWKEYRLNNEVIYLINVHCIFKCNKSSFSRKYYSQDQLGLTIYRHLLKIYEKEPQFLKVAFFSPIPKEKLILLKPENAVLQYHECFHVPFEWNKCIEKINREKDWTVFNNASENLLSGYHKYVTENPTSTKIGVGNKKILFIDDQSNEWQTSLKEIFQKDVIIDLPYKNQEEFRNAWDKNAVTSEVLNQISNCHMILSDFYLKENHEQDNWMNKEHIEKISGFMLFKSIRQTDKGKAIPFIMHTSSNKIPYYKIFDQHGVDDWIVKDTRPNATVNEKRDNYILFKKSIEDISKQNIYMKLQDLWEKIQQIKHINTNRWWYSPLYDQELIIPIPSDAYYNEEMAFIPVNDVRNEYCCYTKGDVVSILESSWFAIRRQINKETDYEEDFNNTSNGNEPDKFLATSICNNLGKIVELLGKKSGAKKISYLTNFLSQIRNSASHVRDYEYFELNDVFICFDYFLHALINFKSLEDFQAAYPYKFIVSRVDISKNENYIFPCALLWLYLQFYNDDSSKQNERGRNSMKTRIKKLHSIIKDKEIVEDVVIKTKDQDFLNTWFYHTFIRDPKINTSEIKKTDPLKISIPVNYDISCL